MSNWYPEELKFLVRICILIAMHISHIIVYDLQY